MRAIALNVRSLAVRLEFLLALPFDVFCLSEVRVAGRTMKGLARVASTMGCAVVWSCSPPPSPTFAVAPGGCAIFVRAPLSLEEVRPPALEKWRSQARVCVARVSDSGGRSYCFASCYGFPPSHQDRSANEGYLRVTLVYLGALTCPSVLLGDLNDHPQTSNALAQAHLAGMYRLTNEDPTTLSKDGTLAAKIPIDHCYVNRLALDSGVQSKVDSTLRVTDHLPVLVHLETRLPHVLCAEWTKLEKKLLAKTVSVPWLARPLDFSQWQEAARAWLETAHAHPVCPKGVVSIKPYQKPKPPQKHLLFSCLLTLQRAVIEIERHGSSKEQELSLKRKMRALGYYRWLGMISRPTELRHAIAKKLDCVVHVRHRKIMNKWKLGAWESLEESHAITCCVYQDRGWGTGASVSN